MPDFAGLHARVIAVATLLFVPVAQAQQPVADFYRGKTITITVGTSAGGGYDNDSRVLSRHLGRFIPGNPNVVVANVPGARGLTSVNRLYSTNPRDGTFMGVVQRGLLSAPWLNPPGVQYDVTKFNWLFSTAAEPGLAIVWTASSSATVKDIRTTEIIIGGAGDSTIIPQVYNYTIGSRFKLVGGYPGTADLVLAMQRGEIQGIGYYSASNVLDRNRSWLTEGKIRVLLQTGTRRDPQLPDVPLVSELALDARKLLIQNLWLAPLDTARPFAMPPEVPPARVMAVRQAFDRMLHDSDFIEDARRSGMPVDPRSAADLEIILKRYSETPQAIIDEARRAVPESD